MKVLDLQCANLHVFEGWFASEDDFSGQCSNGLIQCPVCGNTEVVKRLSAPRLNLGAALAATDGGTHPLASPVPESLALSQGQWLQVCKEIVASTVDVGVEFAEAARKIHYGEAPHRAIRGNATPEQVQTLVDEGIGVLPLLIPEFLLGPRH
jgi:hypothetical protein